jgi:hypothetical protein
MIIDSKRSLNDESWEKEIKEIRSTQMWSFEFQESVEENFHINY